MDPHVYPEAPNPPQLIAAAGNFVSAIEQHATVPAGGGDKMMFIRVAMSPTNNVLPAGTDPTLSLQADTGDFVPLGPSTKLIYRLPGDDLASYVADAMVTPDPTFSNVYKITIFFFDPAGIYNWSLRILNNAGAPRHFTWVVSSTDAGTIQPWINVEPATLTLGALINSASSDSVQVMNKGTGPLTVTGISPALPAGGEITTGALPSAIAPGAKQALTINYDALAATAHVSLPVDLVSGDTLAGTTTGHNKRLTVIATSQELEVVLLLDKSGSMSWDANGNSLPPTSGNSRWAELVSAVGQFLPLLGLFAQNKGQFAIAQFPAPNPLDPASYVIMDKCPILSSDDMDAAGGPVSLVAGSPAPNGSTPMGDGMHRVLDPLTGWFSTDPDSVNNDLRWLLLMTDGAHNSGTHSPYEFVPLPAPGMAAEAASLRGRKISTFAIGYGITGKSDVNPTMLAQIVAGSYSPPASPSQVKRADDANLTAVSLASSFRDAIKAGILSNPSPSDPRGVYPLGTSDVRHNVTITPYDGSSSFVLNWNNPIPSLFRLDLLTPNCELITPSSAGHGQFQGVSFHSGDRFNMYLIDEAFVSNDADPSHPRFGNWTLVISSTFQEPPPGLSRNVPYEYDVVVDSRLRMKLSLNRATYFAGDPIRVTARLTVDGKPITGASVSLSTTAPKQSEVNWIAGLKVPARAMRRAEEMLRGQDSTPLLIKKVAADFAGFQLDTGKKQTQFPMTDPSQTGDYSAVITNTSTPEQYTFYVTATGVTEDGVSFRREGKLSTFVQVRPEPKFTLFDVRFLQSGVAEIVVTPRDKFGNVRLDDQFNTAVNVTARGADFTGPLVSRLDGSYTRQVVFRPDSKPTLSLTFNGRPVLKRVIPPVGRLTWVNQVIKFMPGAEAAKDSNRFRDPRVILDDLFLRPQDRFLALGAHGSVILAVENNLIQRTGGADITVFVPTHKDPRPYEVRVFLPSQIGNDTLRPMKGWVSLGKSKGGTTSFNLPKTASGAAAIWIEDLSGQTRELGGKVMEDPGAVFTGVGVTSVKPMGSLNVGPEELKTMMEPFDK